MTSNNEFIKEFEDDFLTNPRRKIAYLNGDEKRALIGFLLEILEQKDEEWKEECKKHYEEGYEEGVNRLP